MACILFRDVDILRGTVELRFSDSVFGGWFVLRSLKGEAVRDFNFQELHFGLLNGEV